jgi:hypothetical protein
MIRASWGLALVALVVVTGSPYPARAAEFRCSDGTLERRIELSGPDAARGTACEVRYWRDASAPDSGQLLWSAQQDPEFCATKARELVTRLEAGGWACRPGAQPAAPEPTQARAPEGPPAAAPAQPAPPPAPDPSPAAAPAQAAAAPPPRPDRSPAAPAQPSPPAPAQAQAAMPRAAVVPPSADPAAPLLEEVLSETLRSVEQLYGGVFRAEGTAFGDLDGDGAQDAVALITYEAAQNDYVQYLVAYLFNGETFQSVAPRNVGGRFLDAARAGLRGIADGRILVELEALDAEAGCCTTRPTAFVLDGGQLVETPDQGAPGSERTGAGAAPG